MRVFSLFLVITGRRRRPFFFPSLNPFPSSPFLATEDKNFIDCAIKIHVKKTQAGSFNFHLFYKVAETLKGKSKFSNNFSPRT